MVHGTANIFVVPNKCTTNNNNNNFNVYVQLFCFLIKHIICSVYRSHSWDFITRCLSESVRGSWCSFNVIKKNCPKRAAQKWLPPFRFIFVFIECISLFTLTHEFFLWVTTDIKTAIEIRYTQNYRRHKKKSVFAVSQLNANGISKMHASTHAIDPNKYFSIHSFT